MCAIETGYGFRRKTRAYARASSNPSTPTLVRIGYTHVEREAFDVQETAFSQVSEPPDMNSGAIVTIPWRVVFLNQLFCRFDDIAGERQPIEMSDDQPPAWHQETSGLIQGLRGVELVPALTGGYDVKTLVRQGRLLGSPLHIFEFRRPPFGQDS